MMNDHPRNEFYYQSLKAVIKPTTVVVEIGTGSGMLVRHSASASASAYSYTYACPLLERRWLFHAVEKFAWSPGVFQTDQMHGHGTARQGVVKGKFPR